MSDITRFLVALVIIYLVALALPGKWGMALLAVLILGFLALHTQMAQMLSQDIDALFNVVDGGKG